MAGHSVVVGGSTVERVLNCPESYQRCRALPPAADVSSAYAEEGTFAHVVMAALMMMRRGGCDDLEIAAHQLQGTHFHDRALGPVHVEDMIIPALDALDDLEAAYGGGFTVAGVEEHVKFPGVPGAFGTGDLILVSASTVLHVDWKFGSGVGVKAIYADERGERVNAQLMFYLAAAMATEPTRYRGGKSLHRSQRELVIAVIQPRGLEPFTHASVSRREVKMFREDVEHAIALALSRDPPRRRGDWCRFAPCKTTCPLWTGPLLDLAAMTGVPRSAPVNAPSPYGDYLAKAKALVDSLAMLKAEIDEQMHAYLENGGLIPGWRLKAKTKQRKWRDDTARVADELARLGLKSDEIWRRELQTFKVTDAAAKRRGVDIERLDALRAAPPTNETTIATVDDPAPVVERALLIDRFRESLKLLQHEQAQPGKSEP